MMPGTTFQEIRDAIVDAYNEASLEETLLFFMNERLDVITPPAAFGNRVFKLVQWADMNGRDVELVQATAKARPRKQKMQEIYRKYGMTIPVFVQSAGAAVAAAPADAADAGLEKVVRPHLSFADFGVWRERMTRVEGQVCRITLGGTARGTGFLVGPDAVLTNYHVMEPVLKDPKQAPQVTCEFDYKVLKDKSRQGTPVALHATEWLIDSSPYSKSEAEGKPDATAPTPDELDYALVKLAEPMGERPWARAADPQSGAPSRGWVRVPDGAPALKSPMAVLIAQHPDGQPLKLAADTDAINQNSGLWVNGNGTRVRYATNTEPGSSGSPCFDFDWGLIALHHYGDPAYYHPAKYNQGVMIDAIRQRLTKAGKAAALGGDPP